MSVTHLNQVELAARWKISPRTLERWRWTGEGPAFIKIGRRVVYRLEDVEAYEAGVCQSSCRLVSFSGCLFGWPGHGSAAASLMGERVGGPMTFAPGIGAFRVQPDRADGLPVAGLA